MKTKTLSNHWKRTLMASAFTVILLGGYSLLLPEAIASLEATNTETATLQFGPPSFAALVKQVKPAVVNIAIKGRMIPVANQGSAPFGSPEFPQNSPFNELFKHFQQPRGVNPEGNVEREFQAVGSGFFVSSDGYVVTNNHVIDNADEIFVIMQDGTKLTANLKGRDPKTDLALLKVDDDKKFPYVELGNSDKTEVGEWVVAVGNPFGLGGSVTAGIVSARGRDIQSGPYDDYIQVDAPINRGNSGGPLFDSKGQVIGINTAIYSPTGGNVGIAFAIPSNLAKNVVAQLKDSGSVKRGWLGVQIQAIDELVAESLSLDKGQGALVADVTQNSPAAKAGIKIGDVILAIDDEDLKSPKDLSRLIAATEAGKHTELTIMRNGNKLSFDVVIGLLPGDDIDIAKAGQTEQKEDSKLGIQLSSLTPEAREYYGITETAIGVLVTDIEPNSPAAKAGIRPGYIISMVGQESVSSPKAIIEKVALAAKEHKQAVLLLIENQGKKRFISVEFSKA
jgi:serine protease Do